MLRRPLELLPILAIFIACASPAPGPTIDGSGPLIVQPGAPGEASRPFDRESLDEIEGADYTEADTRFMQGMIHHHTQALQMTALVPDRTTDDAFRRMAQRMEISQTDEIAMMQSWLRDRSLQAPDGDPRSGEPLMMMPGMLSPEQMQRLRESSGAEFERYFLEYMIQHHQGAITMVRDLYSTAGAGQESTINFFANEVDADQTIEIRRMQQMLAARR
jgi:uncharacterized protein (DUF305 family)